MSNRRINLAAIVTLLTFLVTSHQGCQPFGSTTTGPPTPASDITIRFAAFNPVVGADTVSSLKMCFSRLRFKNTSGSSGSGNIDLALGEVTITPAGFSLTDVDIPNGTFDRIEFDLDDECGTGESLSVTNNSGTLATSDGITIRFDGLITISSDDSVDLLVQQIVDALAPVTDANDLRTAAEASSGNF